MGGVKPSGKYTLSLNSSRSSGLSNITTDHSRHGALLIICATSFVLKYCCVSSVLYVSTWRGKSNSSPLYSAVPNRNWHSLGCFSFLVGRIVICVWSPRLI